MKNLRGWLAVSAASVLLSTASAGAAAAATARPASTPLPCRAWMSNSHPKDYTTTYVNVHTVAYASVTTVAHYRTTNHTKSAKAGPAGNARIGYYISRATPGYKVVVSVHVVKGKRVGNCSTYFIPQR